MFSRSRFEAVVGTISSAAFDQGHRFVIGRWERSPIGPLVDVMWCRPDGTSTLVVGNDIGAEFITSIYRFDEVLVGPLAVAGDDTFTRVDGHGLAIRLVGGRRRPIPIPRPLTVTRFIEAPIARALMGVQTYGTSPTGAREWYQTRGWRWIVDGSATLDGRDLGSPRPIERPLGVGFSEPPPRPSIVSVKTVIERPPGGPDAAPGSGNSERPNVHSAP